MSAQAPGLPPLNQAPCLPAGTASVCLRTAATRPFCETYQLAHPGSLNGLMGDGLSSNAEASVQGHKDPGYSGKSDTTKEKNQETATGQRSKDLQTA